ncbi:MAG: rhomboid family intramembrane serine protease, partial [Muribaculaceae bacterium]|nr:rhomboid family intramembrane serine protease [Muribaculaceae bacterium]
MASRRLGNYPATALLAALNAAVYVAVLLGADTSTLSLAASPQSLAAAPWSAITYMFSHASLVHFAVNIAVLIVAGCKFESASGSLATLAVYLGGGLAGGLAFVIACSWTGVADATLTGSSAATLALCAAALCTIPGIINKLKETPAAAAGLALAVVIVMWGMTGDNPGGSLAHLAGIAAGIAG